MRNLDKKVIIKLVVVIAITITGMTVFSIDLGIIAPLGGVLLPGNGIWQVPAEVPKEETIMHSSLENDVTVIRDEWGIPHIYASNYTDLAFALGYCHAQDRFFQMDMIRRLVRGRLSELIGEDGLWSDKYHLAMGLEYWGQQMLDEFIALEGAGEIEFMDAGYSYVDGVNYYLNTHKNQLPVEYYLLGATPAEWTVLDSFCLEKYFAFTLSFHYNDINRLVNFEALGPSYYYELFGEFDPYQKPVIPEYGEPGPPLPSPSISGAIDNTDLFNEFANMISAVSTIETERNRMESHEIIGSNNWVINGSKTTTGKPILCWDPHLSFTVPGIFYEVHLVSADLGINYYGITPAGSPLPAEGHNQYIAYGSTNCNYDVMDWYYFNAEGETHYNYNGTLTPYTYRNYTIKVKGRNPEQFSVKETVHGPVVNEWFSRLPDMVDSPDIVISPKWVGHTVTYEPLFYMEAVQAKNRAQFDNASKYFEERPQCIVYADIDGNIAIRPTGKVPIRDDSGLPVWHPGNGTFPYNGSRGEGEWVGYVPFDDLPNSVNPTQKYLQSSNQMPVGPSYTTHFLAHPYADGYRGRRIAEILSNAPDGSIDMERMKEIQLDVNSTAAKAFTPYFLNATENYYGLSPPTSIDAVLTLLNDWNYVMDKEESAPTIYNKWRDYFYDLTFDDEYAALDGFRWPRLNILEYFMRENASSHWFNVVSTPGLETRDDIILLALNQTIDWLTSFYGSSDPTDWRWGTIHKRYFPHLSSLVPFGKGPYDSDGGSATLNVCWTNIRGGVGISTHGPSYRMIADLNNLDNSLSVIPSGQRGFPNSKHYSDQLELLYLQNKYHSQYFSYTPANFPVNSIESTIYFTT